MSERERERERERASEGDLVLVESEREREKLISERKGERHSMAERERESWGLPAWWQQHYHIHTPSATGKPSIII